MRRHTHRSHVSYIDKSREYYAAQGYEHPYRWAAHDDVHFVRPAVPVSDARVALVTTAYFRPGGEPEGVPPARPRRAYAAPRADAPAAVDVDDLFWARDETHTDDLDTYLPVNRLDELVAAGRVGSAAPRFFGVPTEYSVRRTVERDAPEVAEWMRDDGVDVAVLVPI